MTTPAAAYRAERRRQLAARSELISGAMDEVRALLATAHDEVAKKLAAQPSDYQRWRLGELQGEIERMLDLFGEQAGAALDAAGERAWAAGADLVLAPLGAGVYAVTGMAALLDVRQLAAITSFMTDRLKDVAVEAGQTIRRELSLASVGAQSIGDTIAAVDAALGGQARTRAITITRTELGRLYSVASKAAMDEAAQEIPELRKQWRRSGKVHSRLSHDIADGQVREVGKPFAVGGYQMQHPHDPAAPARETINCGCVMLPWIEDWEVANSGRRPFSEEEIARNPMKRALEAELKKQAEKSP